MATNAATQTSQSTGKLGRLWNILKQTGSDWMEDKAMRLSAALSLYTILSLAPLLVITLKIVSLVVKKDKAQKQVQGQVTSLMGAEGAKAITAMLDSAKANSGLLATIVSVVILLFSASAVFGELQDSLNTIWEVKPKPHQPIIQTIKNRLFSISMVFVIAFLLLMSMFVTTILTTLSHQIFGNAGWISIVIDAVGSTLVVAMLFGAIFRVLPDVKLGWKDVALGAGVTAVLFTAGRYLLGLYFTFFSATSAYGAFGSIVAVLLWIYYSSWILFFGAEFTQAYARAQGRWIEPDEHAVKVTEDERAQQGMVSAERLAKKTAQAEGRLKPASRPATAAPQAGSPRLQQVLLAVGGVVAGTLLGGLGVEYLLHDPKKPGRKQQAAVKLNERLGQIEAKFGRVARLREHLDDVRLKERVSKVEKQIRRSTTSLRANQSGRPRWMVRIGEIIAGA